LSGASLQRDGGFEAARNRQGLGNAGMLPPIPEPRRHRKPPSAGRKRWCNAAMPALRRRSERPCAWEDTCQRLLCRCERRQQRHDGMQLMAYTVIHLRTFCGT
jgi:hypothetical protein